MTGGHEGGPHSGDSALTGRDTPTAGFLSPPCEHAAEGGGLWESSHPQRHLRAPWSAGTQPPGLREINTFYIYGETSIIS